MALQLEHGTLNIRIRVRMLLLSFRRQFRVPHVATVHSVPVYGICMNEQSSSSCCSVAECFPEKSRWLWKFGISMRKYPLGRLTNGRQLEAIGGRLMITYQPDRPVDALFYPWRENRTASCDLVVPSYWLPCPQLLVDLGTGVPHQHNPTIVGPTSRFPIRCFNRESAVRCWQSGVDSQVLGVGNALHTKQTNHFWSDSNRLVGSIRSDRPSVCLALSALNSPKDWTRHYTRTYRYLYQGRRHSM